MDSYCNTLINGASVSSFADDDHVRLQIFPGVILADHTETR